MLGVQGLEEQEADPMRRQRIVGDDGDDGGGGDDGGVCEVVCPSFCDFLRG